MENFINEIILGGYSLMNALGYLWFFIIGFLIYGLNEADDRDVNSTNTPKKWSWIFWFKDNWRRYFVTFLSTYIMFIFYVQIVGHEFSNFEALMLGMIGDGVGAKIKKKSTNTSINRKQIMNKINEK